MPGFHRYLTLGLTLFALAATSRGENWPQWRGPTGQGISSEISIPTHWSATENIAWKTEIPGSGSASPIVWGDRVFIAAGLEEGHSRVLHAFDAKTGKLLWTREVVKTSQLESTMHPENGPASSTPLTDGKAVYTSFYGNGRAHFSAIDFDGKILWSVSPLAYESEHGYCHTPAIHDGILILSVDQFKEAAILGIRTIDGSTAWKIDLDNKWCSNVPPLVMESEGRAMVVTSGNSVTRAIDPVNGKQIWLCTGPADYTVAGLVTGAGLLLASGGYPERHVMAIRANGKGDITKSGVAWEKRKSTTYVPSPIFAGGHFYSVTDNGIATCMEAATGNVTWTQRLEGRVRTSLVSAEGNLYTTNEEGMTTVFKADPEKYVEVVRNDFDIQTVASPAISGGKLYYRTSKEIICVGK